MANFDGDKILVTLSQPDADRYAMLKANPALTSLLASAFVLPVLVRAVQQLHDDRETWEGCNWAAVLTRRAEELGIDLADPVRAAQQLYGMPIARAFQSAQGLSAGTDAD